MYVSVDQKCTKIDRFAGKYYRAATNPNADGPFTFMELDYDKIVTPQ